MNIFEKKIKCSVPILTLNSARWLEQCLESVKDFDDVYIFDGNSTDDTMAIAKKYNVPVHKQYDSEEKNIRIKNFTEIRIRAHKAHRYDWILILDSDEYISAGLSDDIRRVLSGTPEAKTAYVAEIKMVIGGKVIEHTFNNFPYALRLFNVHSGIAWKGAKIVHEKLAMPEDIQIATLSHPFYSYSASSYREAVKKDDYYLSLSRQKMFSKARSEKSKKTIIIAAVKNFLRAVNIVRKSVIMYIQHGFAHTLPVSHVWRYIRYHLLISWYRIQELYK